MSRLLGVPCMSCGQDRALPVPATGCLDPAGHPETVVPIEVTCDLESCGTEIPPDTTYTECGDDNYCTWQHHVRAHWGHCPGARDRTYGGSNG